MSGPVLLSLAAPVGVTYPGNTSRRPIIMCAEGCAPAYGRMMHSRWTPVEPDSAARCDRCRAWLLPPAVESLARAAWRGACADLARAVRSLVGDVLVDDDAEPIGYAVVGLSDSGEPLLVANVVPCDEQSLVCDDHGLAADAPVWARDAWGER